MNRDSTRSYPAPLPLDLSKLTIRHLTAADLPALEWDGEYTHFRRLYAEAYTRAQKGEAVLWVADLEGVGVIGQLFVQLATADRGGPYGDARAYIYSFRVRPAYRGVGVGSRLLEVAEQDLIRRGIRKVTLNVARDNRDARRFYERHGYRVVAPEPGRWQYLDDRGRLRTVHEPSWRMGKKLSALAPGVGRAARPE